jgi:hypothetical protein
MSNLVSNIDDMLSVIGKADSAPWNLSTSSLDPTKDLRVTSQSNFQHHTTQVLWYTSFMSITQSIEDYGKWQTYPGFAAMFIVYIKLRTPCSCDDLPCPVSIEPSPVPRSLQMGIMILCFSKLKPGNLFQMM